MFHRMTIVPSGDWIYYSSSSIYNSCGWKRKGCEEDQKIKEQQSTHTINKTTNCGNKEIAVIFCVSWINRHQVDITKIQWNWRHFSGFETHTHTHHIHWSNKNKKKWRKKHKRIMALVMLPCDLPWWSSICKRLTLLQQTDDTYMILEIMLRIHDLCK